MSALIDQLQRWSELTAEGSGLHWSDNGARIIEIEREKQAIHEAHPIFKRPAQETVFPLYQSIDDGELSGGFFLRLPTSAEQQCGLLDLLAARICEDCPLPVAHHGAGANWYTALVTFGADIIAPCFAVLRETLASVRYCHARAVLHGDGGTVEAAPIGTDDPRFDEAGVADCSGDDEHATLIVRFDIDEEPLGPVMEMIEARGKAARRVLRGEAG